MDPDLLKTTTILCPAGTSTVITTNPTAPKNQRITKFIVRSPSKKIVPHSTIRDRNIY